MKPMVLTWTSVLITVSLTALAAHLIGYDPLNMATCTCAMVILYYTIEERLR